MNILGVSLILVSTLGLIYCAFLIGDQDGRQASVERLDGACRGHHVPIMFNYHGVKTTGNKLWLNSTIISKEDIDKEPTLSVRIQRCKNRENLDTCEIFHLYKTDKYCTLLEADSEIWSPFFAGFTPRWKCPIKKGKYQGVDNMLDLSALLSFPMDNWVWKVTGEIRDLDTDRLLQCLLVEARVISK